MLATLCVATSLALVDLGGSDPSSRFHLGILSIYSPSTIVGPVLDTVAVYHNVKGASCEELGWRVNPCLLDLFTVPARARRFASSVVTPMML
jgi:hypothetical protein